MIRIMETLAGQRIRFHGVQSTKDLYEVRDFIKNHDVLGIDTESTGINCYRPTWQLRMSQFGDAWDSYTVPARYKKFLSWVMEQDMFWIGHNGPHDIRSIDAWLGYDTGVVCDGETYIPGHYADARNQAEGGIGHGLKEQAMALIDRNAGKWEKELKEAFKQIKVPIPGEFYKSSNKNTGAVKGQPKMRKIRLDEGWGLIDPAHPAYVAYAAADPLLTYRVWHKRRDIVEKYRDLYDFDHRVQQACDRLQRRAIKLNQRYTERLSRAYTRTAQAKLDECAAYGCDNINSTVQLADTLIRLGATLTEKTETRKWKVDANILRKLVKDPYTNGKVKDFINNVLVAKQILKRRESYTDAMLREMDEVGRIHPSINSLAARTTRMSVSGPPLQQLPTKDKEDELMWSSEEVYRDE